MNKVWLTGRLTVKPELKKTSSGKEMSTFSIAVPKDKDHTSFIRCVCWGTQAENLCKYQDKGNLIGVEGELNTRDYEGKTYTEVTCSHIEFLGGKKEPSVEPPTNPFESFNAKTKSKIDEQISIEDEDYPWD